MIKMVDLVEDEREGFLALIGQHVMIMCANYIYAGKLVGVNNTCVKLNGARIVYETGPLNSKKYKDAQPLPNTDWYIQLTAVESFGIGMEA
jgi:hypothetical protein